MVISLTFSYYIADYQIPKLVAFLGLAGILYIFLTLFTYIGKAAVTILKRSHSLNIVLFATLYFVLYRVFGDVSRKADFENWVNYLVPLGLTLVIFIFTKSLVSFFYNGKKFSIIFLIPSGGALALILFFMFTPGSSEKSGMNYSQVGDLDLDTEAIYSSNYIDYGLENENTISLSKYVNYRGRTKKIRDTVLGRDLSEVPIKGKIWYPENKKNSPVVFIVHGNHRLTEENYLGYNYLGRYLARRGIIAVTVDMNMLNGFMKYGLRNENDARAILLLENIKYILSENKNSESKIYELIDEKNIALAGHSRGGEAICIAENFNKLKYNPDNGESLNYNFNIKGIVAISPTVDQYNPSGKDVVLKDVNFLTIHGTHDGDVTGFDGMKLYNNTSFSQGSDNFKSAIYLGYANHGQFNEIWGDADSDPPREYFINKGALLEGEVQQEVLCKYVHNFLENTYGLKRDRGLFKEPSNYKLPETVYYSRYSDSSFVDICNFDEDYNMATFKYGESRFKNFLRIREESVEIGGFDIENTALHLSFNGKGNYELVFNQFVEPKNYLQFDLMSMDKEERFEDLKFKVAITDSFGNRGVVDVSEYIKLSPQIKVELSKLQKFNDSYDYKGSFETVRIPLKDFIKDMEFNLNEIKYLEFIFDGGSNSSILLDNIGYSN